MIWQLCCCSVYNFFLDLMTSILTVVKWNFRILSDKLQTPLSLVPHIYAQVNWASIGSANGLLPVQHQAITWTNAGLLSIWPQGTNFSEIAITIKNFSFTKYMCETDFCAMTVILSRSRWVLMEWTNNPTIWILVALLTLLDPAALKGVHFIIWFETVMDPMCEKIKIQ